MSISGVPITLVSGFLGAGKTTLINQMLAQTEVPAEEIAIIVNELGEVGIDHQLMIQAQEKIYQLNNGCICCSLREDLAEALLAIGRYFEETGGHLRYVIIESTGIADPAPIAQTISLSPILSQTFFIDAVLTVVDCQNFDVILEQNNEVYQQVSYADRFILSKRDTQSGETIEAIMTTLKEINPLADFRNFDLDTGYAVEDFFNLGLFHGQIQPLTAEDHDHKGHHHDHDHDGHDHPHDHEHDHEGHHDHDHDHDHEGHHPHDHHHHHHHHDFMSMVVTTQLPLDEKLFLQWLDWLLMTFNGQLYRYKGLLNIQNRDLVIAIQGVNVAYRFDMTKYEHGQVPTQFVLIGKHLDEKLIEQSFKELEEMSAFS